MFTRTTNRTSGEQTHRKLCVYYWSLRAEVRMLHVRPIPGNTRIISSRGRGRNRNTLSVDNAPASQKPMMYIYAITPSFANLPNDVLGISQSDIAPILAVTSRNSSLALKYCSGVDKIWTIYFTSYSLFDIQFSHIFVPKNVGTLTLKERSDWDHLFYIFTRSKWFSRIASRQIKAQSQAFLSS